MVRILHSDMVVGVCDSGCEAADSVFILLNAVGQTCDISERLCDADGAVEDVVCRRRRCRGGKAGIEIANGCVCRVHGRVVLHDNPSEGVGQSPAGHLYFLLASRGDASLCLDDTPEPVGDDRRLGDENPCIVVVSGDGIRPD